MKLACPNHQKAAVARQSFTLLNKVVPVTIRSILYSHPAIGATLGITTPRCLTCTVCERWPVARTNLSYYEELVPLLRGEAEIGFHSEANAWFFTELEVREKIA